MDIKMLSYIVILLMILQNDAFDQIQVGTRLFDPPLKREECGEFIIKCPDVKGSQVVCSACPSIDYTKFTCPKQSCIMGGTCLKCPTSACTTQQLAEMTKLKSEKSMTNTRISELTASLGVCRKKSSIIILDIYASLDDANNNKKVTFGAIDEIWLKSDGWLAIYAKSGVSKYVNFIYSTNSRTPIPLYAYKNYEEMSDVMSKIYSSLSAVDDILIKGPFTFYFNRCMPPSHYKIVSAGRLTITGNKFRIWYRVRLDKLPYQSTNAMNLKKQDLEFIRVLGVSSNYIYKIEMSVTTERSYIIFEFDKPIKTIIYYVAVKFPFYVHILMSKRSIDFLIFNIDCPKTKTRCKFSLKYQFMTSCIYIKVISEMEYDNVSFDKEDEFYYRYFRVD